MLDMMVLKLLKNLSAKFRDIPKQISPIFPQISAIKDFIFWFHKEICGKPVFNPS